MNERFSLICEQDQMNNSFCDLVLILSSLFCFVFFVVVNSKAFI